MSERETDSTTEQQRRTDWEWEPRERGCGTYKAKVRKRDGSEGSKEESVTSFHVIGGWTTEAKDRPGWRINDIPLAARVLRKEQPPPVYSNEAEMRRVFGLVYNVFRYKKIFIRALNDIGFWRGNEAIKDREKVVWLLVHDMQGRKFTGDRAGGTQDAAEREKIFRAAGLTDIEDALLQVKTHLAASISRLRIRGSALNLDELLPTRLRGIVGVPRGEEGAVATGWINTAMLGNKEEFLREMSLLRLICCECEGATELDENEYAFDSICPKMVALHECSREALATSDLVRRSRFVFLERSLCLGAAVLARLVRRGRISGPIVLTHSLAPRHTGYLAGLLADIEHAGRLFAFGSGDRRCEYESYLKQLGVTMQQCRVFSEKYGSHPAINELERATVALVIPPCSYTGVKDIVDLAVARGGDSELLESVTDICSDVHEYDHEQWRNLLSEQMNTLRYVLTRPNVQLVVYEVHTVLPLESAQMIRAAVEHVNRMATEKHTRERPVPDCDLFEISSVEDTYEGNVSGMFDPGCFIAVIRRKEMTQLGSLFMIKVAESKGLFGEPAVREQPKFGSPQPDPDVRVQKRARRSNKIEIRRIMAHTYSSLCRSTQGNQVCPRHMRCSSWEHAAGQQVDPNAPEVEGPLSKAREKQKESVNRLYAAGTKYSRRKELRMISRMISPRVDGALSRFKGAGRLEGSAFPDKLLGSEAPLPPRYDGSHSSSAILRSPILARAVRRVPLEDDDDAGIESDDREEKIRPPLKMYFRSWTARKTRLLHPAGSPTNVLESLRDVA